MRAAASLFLLLAACAPRRATVDAPTVVTVASVGSVAPPPRPAPALTGECHASLTLTGDITLSSEGCYLDTSIRDHVGQLVYACDGDGKATADFGPQHYEGTIRDGKIDIHVETELDWEDGCRWGTTANIRGEVKGVVKDKLVWTYADHVLTGTGCSGVCRANATFDVSD